MKRNILGPRIRERRRELGITQAALAGQIEISASYLNLIEHNKRDIGGSLLRRVADVLELPLDQLDGAADRRLMESLEAIAQNPELRALGIESDSIGELIGRFPGWARGIAALSRSELEATNMAQVLGDRLNHDPFLGETVHRMLTRIASLHSAAEIIRDSEGLEVDQRERFFGIMHEESLRLGDLGDALASYFDRSAWAQRTLTPMDEVDAFFDERNNHFAEIESFGVSLHEKLPSGNQAARLAKATSLVESRLKQRLGDIIAGESRLETEIARARALEVLQRYAVGAVIMPLETFRHRALELKFDIEMLATEYAVAYDLICERLSALPAQGDLPQFGYFRANASGNIVASRNLPGLVVPRYGSACPLWILYRAQQAPQTVLRQHVQLPSGEGFVFVARAGMTGSPGFNQPRHYLTDLCVISDKDAAQTIYAPDQNTPFEPVGLSCRTCPRKNCGHRVIDPLAG